LQGMAGQWREIHTGRWTLHIPGMEENRAEMAGELQQMLKERGEVENVRILTEAEVKEMLTPWLGEGKALDMLPLPQLIEMDIKGPSEDAAALRTLLKEKFP